MGNYRQYNRSYLTFFISSTNRIYVSTTYQNFVILHAQGIFYENSPQHQHLARQIKYSSIKDINSLVRECTREKLALKPITRIP